MGASLASCWSRDTPGEEPNLQQPSLDERPGHPGDAVPPGEEHNLEQPSLDEQPGHPGEACECCYYNLGSKKADGDYTCGWQKNTNMSIWWHRYTWWHGNAPHGMIDRNEPRLGMNSPGTPQCPCCYYRLVGDDGTGPGWYLTYERNYREWKWNSKGAVHWKPPNHWENLEDLEEDSLDMPPGDNLALLALEDVAADAPGSSTQGIWRADDYVSVRVGDMYMHGLLMPPPPPPGTPPRQGRPAPPRDPFLEHRVARMLEEDMLGNLGYIE